MTEREYKLKTYKKRLGNLEAFLKMAKEPATKAEIQMWIADTSRLIREIEAA